MGVAKSLATIYSDREYLLYYIERDDYDNISKLLEKRPQLLNQKLTLNTKMTPLFRACFNGNLEMVKFLVEKWAADVNQVTDNNETPLIAAVKRNHLRLVKYLVEQGANCSFVSIFGLTPIEFAILPGYYEIALLLYERSRNKQLRTAEDYEQFALNYHYRYVNYPMFLENLTKMIDPENVPNYLKKEKKIYKDPVTDPRETWKDWTKRQILFKDPPLVERDQLPTQLRPQNRRFGKIATYFSASMISPLSQKPSYEPRAKKVVAESQNQIKGVGQQLTNEEMEMKTMP